MDYFKSIFDKILQRIEVFDKKAQFVILFLILIMGLGYFNMNAQIRSNEENIKANEQLYLRQLDNKNREIMECHNALIIEVRNCKLEVIALIREVNAIKAKIDAKN
jgi:hypothetical protein